MSQPNSAYSGEPTTEMTLAGVQKARQAACDGINWVQKTCAVLKLPPLSDYGITETDFQSLIEKGQKARRMKGNPVQLTEEEMKKILQQAL